MMTGAAGFCAAAAPAVPANADATAMVIAKRLTHRCI
jgi:hypothetical protein